MQRPIAQANRTPTQPRSQQNVVHTKLTPALSLQQTPVARKKPALRPPPSRAAFTPAALRTHQPHRRCLQVPTAQPLNAPCKAHSLVAAMLNCLSVVTFYTAQAQTVLIAKKGVTWGQGSAVFCSAHTALENRRRCKSFSTVSWCAACWCAPDAAPPMCC